MKTNFKILNTLALAILSLIFIQCGNNKKKVVKTENELPPTPKEYIVKKDAVTDIDGNTYNSVMINDKEWMTTNLRVTRLNDGTEIKLTRDDKEWNKYGDMYYSYVNKDSLLTPNYGLYYNYSTVITDKLCPDGWYVASKEDWVDGIIHYTRDQNEDYYYEKELRSKTDWHYPDMKGNDKYKLSILPSGIRDEKGKIVDFKAAAGFWTSTHDGGCRSCMFNTGGGMGIRVLNWHYGQVVRCVKSKIKKNVVTDIDGNSYNSVIIGNNEWLSTNLRVTHLNDGTPIKDATSEEDWRHQNKKPCYARIDSTMRKQHYISLRYPLNDYGLYYNCFAVASGKLCPPGWRIATTEDWEDAIEFFKQKFPPPPPAKEKWERVGNEQRSQRDHPHQKNFYRDEMIASKHRYQLIELYDRYEMNLMPMSYRSDSGEVPSFGNKAFLWALKKNEIVFFESSKGKIIHDREINTYQDYGSSNLALSGLPIRCVKIKEEQEESKDEF